MRMITEQWATSAWKVCVYISSVYLTGWVGVGGDLPLR